MKQKKNWPILKSPVLITPHKIVMREIRAGDMFLIPGGRDYRIVDPQKVSNIYHEAVYRGRYGTLEDVFVAMGNGIEVTG
jgi:hypothetical protein